MKALTLTTLALFLAVGPLDAASVPMPAALPIPAIDIGKCCGPFNCEAYLEVASALQALPEAQRIAQLRAWAAAKDFGRPALAEPVVALCRMLFEPKPGQAFMPSSLLTANFVGLVDDSSPDYGLAQAWPLSPITLVDDVPFAVVGEISLDPRYYQGRFTDLPFKNLSLFYESDFDLRPIRFSRRDAVAYLEYCLNETRWTTRRYAPATPAALARALNQLLSQHPWPQPLDRDQLAFFTDQIASPTPLPCWINGVSILWSNRTDKFNYPRGQSGPDRPQTITIGGEEKVSFKVDLGVNGGVRPYHFTATRQGNGEAEPAIIAQTLGRPEIFNPYSSEEFTVRFYHPAGGDRTVFKLVNDAGELVAGIGDKLLFAVEDAQGAKQTLVIRVIDLGVIEILPPAPAPLPQPPATATKSR